MGGMFSKPKAPPPPPPVEPPAPMPDPEDPRAKADFRKTAARKIAASGRQSTLLSSDTTLGGR
jgi:hypothetical protein